MICLVSWEGFPVTASAPTNVILLGAKGASSSSAIQQLAQAVVRDDLLGIMVWYASIKNGFDYAPVWDASTHNDAISGYKSAMQLFRQAMGTPEPVNPAPVVEPEVPVIAPAPFVEPVAPVVVPAPVVEPVAPVVAPAPVVEPEAPAVAPVLIESEPETVQEITQSSSSHPAWPSKILGLYVLLADDTEEGFESSADWDPKLFAWQQEASNVLFFTFI